MLIPMRNVGLYATTYAFLLFAITVLVLQTLLHAVNGRTVARISAPTIALGHRQDLLMLGP